MKSKNFLIVAVLVAIAALIYLFSRDSLSDSQAKVRIAEGTQPIAAPIYIAYAKGYFKDEKLDVELIPFATGKLCLDALIGGNADFATVAETPLMHAVFTDQSVKIVSTIHRSRQNTYLVANKIKGINGPNDLKGKTIAVPIGTNAEYALSAFLLQNGLKFGNDDSGVKLLNLSPPEMIGPIAKGNVDGIAAWQPHVGRCADTLNENSIIFSFAPVYEETYNLVASKLMAEEKTEITVRVLKALDRAVNFMKANPDESIDIVSNRIGMKKDELQRLWPIYRFGLDLKKSLIETMESQGKWAVAQDQHKGTPPPMSNIISATALMEVKRDSVLLR